MFSSRFVAHLFGKLKIALIYCIIRQRCRFFFIVFVMPHSNSREIAFDFLSDKLATRIEHAHIVEGS